MSKGGILIIPQTNSKRPSGRPKRNTNSELKDTEKLILFHNSLSQQAFAKKQDEAALTQLSLTVVSVFSDGIA
ncbi:hypothetical protein MK805_05975 [Shimazuella sp. AN120528]|uniref:hypothetical protein n=1 Tax=Shimazuella soli TaxID=1892854 RepID=UPI001F0F418A|nr:hypothetical protein [Shimazuella soli]MCH5584516.1 hypothetical protein [Shimazuella soli]